MFQSSMHFKTLLILWTLFGPLLGTAQGKQSKPLPQQDEVVIKRGEIYVLEGTRRHLRKLIIKGKLIVLDENDMDLTVGQLVIDGGQLEVGSLEKAFTHKLKVRLISRALALPSFLKVVNGGSLIIHGPKDSPPVDFQDGWENKIQEDLGRNIVITPYSSKYRAAVIIENTEQVFLSGVHFKGLGIPDSLPAVSWSGQTHTPGWVSNSVFTESLNTDLLLDKTSVSIKNNIFISKKGRSIHCSPSGRGSGNQIDANYIVNWNTNSFFALTCGNPYQSITNNYLHMSGTANGIGFLRSDGLEKSPDSVNKYSFHFSNNHVRRTVPQGTPHLTTPETMGIFIDDFEHSGIWSLSHNHIDWFDRGIHNKSKNVVLEKCTLRNNTVGVIPGPAYLLKSSISWTHPIREVGNQKAIWVTDGLARSDPKVSEVAINNYPVGVVFEGRIGPNNYFQKIDFHNTAPIKFTNLDPMSFVLDKDGSFFKGPRMEDSENDKALGHDHHAMMHGHHHKKAMGDTGFILFSKQSIFRVGHSKPLEGNPEFYYSPKSSFGQLTVSTGFGLHDPIHEHDFTFNDLKITNAFSDYERSFSEPGNRRTILLMGDTEYKLDYDPDSHPLYDLSFGWDAPPGSWIVLQVPYPHKNVRGLRAFGSLLPESPTLDLLRNKKETCYYVDKQADMVYIKIHNQKTYDELVLYSPKIATEISIQNKRIPLEIKTNTKLGEIEITYRIPQGIASKLVLMDYFGNPLKTLVDGVQPREQVTARIALKEFDVRERLFHYSLTCEGKTHKGPIYAY